MLRLGIFGGASIDGSELEMGDRLVAVAIFGGLQFNFSATPPPPAVDIIAVTIFGGVSIDVQPRQAVRLAGFSVFGGRHVEPLRQLPHAAIKDDPDGSDESDDLPLELAAYSLFGGIAVRRN